jgi:predicted HD phosphohydrolase
MKEEFGTIIRVMNKLLAALPNERAELSTEVEAASRAVNKIINEQTVIECLLHDLGKLGEPRVIALFGHYEVKLIEDEWFRKHYTHVQAAIRKKQAEVRDDITDDEQQ